MSPNPKPYYKKLSKSKRKKLAFKAFERDSHFCQYCTRPRSEYMSAIHPHHRIFVSQGGQDDLDNIATACWFCHRDHGDLKHKKLITETDDTKINELRKRYL